MILELDVGNTRVKWRCLDAAGFRLQGGAWMLGDSWAGLSALPRHLDAVRIASVAGDAADQELAGMIRERWQLSARFALTVSRQAGVTNSYAEPSTMGVDRWLAMLGAWSQQRSAFCIASCGTAVTIDLVDDTGQHLGGYILPGLKLMTESLHRRTARIRFAQTEPSWQTRPGVSTTEAVHHGSLLAICGALKTALNTQDGRSVCYLTGGDGSLVAEHLGCPATVRDELVLDGLAISLP